MKQDESNSSVKSAQQKMASSTKLSVSSSSSSITQDSLGSNSNSCTSGNDANQDEKQMVGGCCVCADDTGYSDNQLVYCDGLNCLVAVHQGCYGINNIPDGPWFCRVCEYKESLSNEADKQKVDVCCELCPSKEGAFKRTESGKWAHVICALYIPEITFGNNRTMEPIITTNIRLDRYNKKCSICELNDTETNECGNGSSENTNACADISNSNGVYVSCGKAGCKHWFHVTCAQMNGLLCEVSKPPTVHYSIYCKSHYSKLSNLDIKRIPLFKFTSTTINSIANSDNNELEQNNQAKSKKDLKRKSTSAVNNAEKKKSRVSTPNSSTSTTSTTKTSTSSSTKSRSQSSNSDKQQTNKNTQNTQTLRNSSNERKSKSIGRPSSKTNLLDDDNNNKEKTTPSASSTVANKKAKAENDSVNKTNKDSETPKTQTKKEDINNANKPLNLSISKENDTNHSNSTSKLNKTPQSSKTSIKTTNKSNDEQNKTDDSNKLANNKVETQPQSLFGIKDEKSTSPKDQVFIKKENNETKEEKSNILQQQQSSDSGIASISSSSEDKDNLNSSTNSSKSAQDVETKHQQKRKLRGSNVNENDEPTQLITPLASSISSGSSSGSCSSSISSTSSNQLKSPNQKRARKINQNKSNDTTMQNSADNPLTPPPSVLQEHFDNSNEQSRTNAVDIFGNHLNSSATFSSNVTAYKSAIKELNVSDSSNEFKLPTTVPNAKQNDDLNKPKSSTLKSLMDCPKTLILNPKDFGRLQLLQRPSKTNNTLNNSTDSNADSLNNDDSTSPNNRKNSIFDRDEPNTLEDLLFKQWNLGAELLKEQTESFDVIKLLNLLDTCQKENLELERKLDDLKKQSEHLTNLHDKLSTPFPQKELHHQQSSFPPPSPVPQHHQQLEHEKLANRNIVQPHVSTSQMHSLPNLSSLANNTQSPSKKQNILLSASPISSSSSSPNNSLMNLNNSYLLNQISPMAQQTTTNSTASVTTTSSLVNNLSNILNNPSIMQSLYQSNGLKNLLNSNLTDTLTRTSLAATLNTPTPTNITTSSMSLPSSTANITNTSILMQQQLQQQQQQLQSQLLSLPKTLGSPSSSTPIPSSTSSSSSSLTLNQSLLQSLPFNYQQQLAMYLASSAAASSSSSSSASQVTDSTSLQLLNTTK